jgi:hypothetical protein
MKMKEIKTTFGGPCIYKQGVLEDGTLTGKIQDMGQSKEQLEKELIESVESGRDDLKSFIATI